MSEWIPVYQAANSLEAHTLKGAMEVAGIAVLLQGEALSGALGELPVNAVEVTLLIHPGDLKEARLILEQYRRGSCGSWRCPHCGEPNAASFEICWRCGQEPEAEEKPG
ncbi:putative signal transducing protein [Zobellella sp. An-6]|uniref:putative signal transducing protein n=1 Tax=Zobellella sp. An-6 TaxID=3400218 RepID=UPI0040410A58